MTRHEADYVARLCGKTPNWVKRNASRYPHSKAGRTYYWDDQDVADFLAALRVRPSTEQAPAESDELRPIPTRSRRAS